MHACLLAVHLLYWTATRTMFDAAQSEQNACTVALTSQALALIQNCQMLLCLLVYNDASIVCVFTDLLPIQVG